MSESSSICDIKGVCFKPAITNQGNALDYHNIPTELPYVVIKLVCSLICSTLVLMANQRRDWTFHMWRTLKESKGIKENVCPS